MLKPLVGTLLILVAGDTAWADGLLPRCGFAFKSARHCRISRIVGRNRLCRSYEVKAEESVWIGWKLEVGKTFYQEMTTDTTQTMTVMGQNITQKQKVTFYLSWTPVAKDNGGNWTVKQKIDGLKMEIEIGGNKIPFDSTKEQGQANPLSGFYKALLGSEFTLTIDKDMKISKIEGRDEFVKKLIKKNEGMEPFLKAILSDEALKQMSDPAFAAIPNKAVKKGDTWEKNTTLDMGPIGNFNTSYKFTYVGSRDKNHQKIKVDLTLKYTAPGDNAGGVLPFKILKADLSSKDSKGDVLFDSDKGRVESSTMTIRVIGTMSIEIGGMPSEIALDQIQTTTVKTTDTNPIRKK
jgi:hypothetical protein